MTQPRIAAIVLAAGAATRFGSPKQLAMFRGEPLLMRAVRHVREAGAAPIIVLLGANATRIAPVLGKTDYMTIVMNNQWHTGIASSLRAGLAAVPPDADGVLITTGDQPLVDGVMLAKLIDRFSSGCRVVAAEYGGVVGVPALVGREHLDELGNTVTGDRGAAAWLRLRGESVTLVALPEAASDVDTVDALDDLDWGWSESAARIF